MGTYLKNWMLFKSSWSNKIIESYSEWELNEKKVVLRPSNPSTLTEAIIEFDIEVDAFQGVLTRPDIIPLYDAIQNLPDSHKIRIKVYENNNIIDDEDFETSKIPLGL